MQSEISKLAELLQQVMVTSKKKHKCRRKQKVRDLETEVRKLNDELKVNEDKLGDKQQEIEGLRAENGSLKERIDRIKDLFGGDGKGKENKEEQVEEKGEKT